MSKPRKEGSEVWLFGRQEPGVTANSVAGLLSRTSFLLPLAVGPADISLQKPSGSPLTGFFLSYIKESTVFKGYILLYRPHFQSVQFGDCPCTCAVGRKWFKENRELFCVGLASEAFCGPLSGLP